MYLSAFLLFTNILFSVFCIAKMCVSKKGVEINHFFTFSFGFLYYWILPIGFGLFEQLKDTEEMFEWYSQFRQVSHNNIAIYLILSIISYSFFVFGNVITAKKIDIPLLYSETPKNKCIEREKIIVGLLFFIVVAISVYYALSLQGELFRGYSEEVFEGYENGKIANGSLRGSFVASTSGLFSIAITYTIRRNLHNFNKAISNIFLYIYWVFAIIAASMGGRLYLMISVMNLLVYKTVFFERIKFKSFLIASVVLSLVLGGYGVIRAGGSLQIDKIVMNLVQEPVYTSFSLLAFITNIKLEAINFPLFLIGDFINLIPSSLLPGKDLLLLDPRNYGYIIYTPLGAISSFISCQINFGVLGTCAFFFAIGATMSIIKNNCHNHLSKITYIGISGCLAFTFFRDPFSISIVKNILEFSFLAPALIIFLIHVVNPESKSLSKNN
jgi:hypothetical protein